MKVRSLRQVLHWLFLGVGVFSVFMLAFSISTYLNYSRDGYGLRVSVEEAWLDGELLFLNMNIENPGGFDLLLGPDGNLTIDEMHDIYIMNLNSPHILIPIEAEKTTSVLLSFHLNTAELESIRSTGLIDFSMNLEVTVNQRHTITNLYFSATDQDVRI